MKNMTSHDLKIFAYSILVVAVSLAALISSLRFLFGGSILYIIIGVAHYLLPILPIVLLSKEVKKRNIISRLKKAMFGIIDPVVGEVISNTYTAKSRTSGNIKTFSKYLIRFVSTDGKERELLTTRDYLSTFYGRIDEGMKLTVIANDQYCFLNPASIDAEMDAFALLKNNALFESQNKVNVDQNDIFTQQAQPFYGNDNYLNAACGNGNVNQASNVNVIASNNGTINMPANNIVDNVACCTMLNSKSNPVIGKVKAVKLGEMTVDGFLYSIFPNNMVSLQIGENKLKQVVVPQVITQNNVDYTVIGCENMCFMHNNLAESIKLPSSVTSIGSYAFSVCDNITRFAIPDGVDNIGKAAFQGCKKLESIIMPSQLISIPPQMFWECDSLKSITLPNSIASIGKDAFRDCKSLTKILLTETLASIEEGAFSGCISLKEIFIPISTTVVGSNVFNECSDDLIIRVEADMQPAGWDNNWNSSGCKVSWGWSKALSN